VIFSAVVLGRALGINDTIRATDTTSGIDGEPVEGENPSPLVHEITPDGGGESGGLTVTILGESLPAPPCKVYFGDDEATIVSSSSTQIVVTTPAHAPESDPGAFDIVPVTIKPPGQNEIDATHFVYDQD